MVFTYLFRKFNVYLRFSYKFKFIRLLLLFNFFIQKLKYFYDFHINSIKFNYFVFTCLLRTIRVFYRFCINSSRFDYFGTYLLTYSVSLTISKLVQINILGEIVTYFNAWRIMPCTCVVGYTHYCWILI